MRSSRFLLPLTAILLLVAVLVWVATPTPTDTPVVVPQTNVVRPTAPQPSVAEPLAVSAPSNVTAPLATPKAARQWIPSGSVTPHLVVKNQQILGRWTTPPDAEGNFQRAEIAKNKFAPLLIQTVETVRATDGVVLSRSQVRAGRALVKLAPGNTRRSLETAAVAIGAKVGRQLGNQGWYELIGAEVDPGTVERLITAMSGPGKPVLLAEPDYILHTLATPNDPRYADGSLWGLHNTGQNSGTSDADIDAPEAWDIRREAPGVVVAIIDTGINPNHEDLQQNLWINPSEVAGNGIDDDGNGYIDDVYGINAIANTGDPTDDHGHGSHCAGTIGARGDNTVGIAGVAWNVKLMGLKFLSATGSGAGSDAIQCLEYARLKGAHILSNSWGGGSFSSALQDTITAGRNAGQIFVAAAANNSANNDFTPLYPAGYLVDNIVSVAATTRTDVLADFSNYGSGWVHVAAPGKEILSASHSNNSGYVSMSGTSMATPHVAGMLALIKAQYPSDSSTALVNRLLNSADAKAALEGKVATAGRLNLHKALSNAPSTPFNDAFSASQLLSGSSISVRATNFHATSQAGEPVHAGLGSATTSLWYRWVAPTTGTFYINTVGSAIDTVLAVYTGSAVNSLTQVAANDDDAGQPTSRVGFSAVVGATYHFAISGKGAAQGLVRLSLSGPPSNDHLANAINLPEFPAFGNGSNLNATKEPGEPDHAGFPGGHSIWAKWTSTMNGTLVAHTTGSNVDTLFAVYAGPASAPTYGGLTLVAQNDDYAAAGRVSSLVRFNASLGTTYYFASDGKAGVEGNLAISIHPEEANDSFANRAALVGVPVSVEFNNLYATRETGEPDHAASGGIRSLWWTWTAPSTGTYQIDTGGSNAGTSLGVYTGSSLNTLTTVASAWQNFANAQCRVFVQATAGTTYAIAVDNPVGIFGLAKLNIKAITVAPNNNFAAASTILGTPTLGNPIVVTGDNQGATQEAGEPGSSTETDLSSVWWNWTAPATAKFTVSTEGSDFDTVLGVFTGGAVNALTTIAEDDDSGPEFTSRLSFDAVAGTTYRFRVFGFASVNGSITLKLETWQPVANDSFSTPIVFNGTTYRYTQYNNEATAEAGEPAHAGTVAANSVWFSYTALADGAVTLATDGSQYSTRVAVYTGSVVNALTPVASNDNYHTLTSLGQVTWQATAGTTYRLAVDSNGAGGFLAVSLLVGPTNDLFASRTQLGSVSSYSETTYNHGATKEVGEPTNFAGTFTGKTLWWTWTAPSSGQWEISTEGSTVQYFLNETPVTLNTVLAVFTGPTVSSLTGGASNDNIDSLRGVLTSRVILNATSGATYHFCVAGATNGTSEDHLKRASQGEIKFSLKPFQKASNDNLAAATVVNSSLPALFELTNAGLGVETGEPGTVNNQTPNYDSARSKGTAWWKWTAPSTGRYHAATGGLYEVGKTENTILSLYTGPASSPSFGGLTLVSWDKDSAGAGYSSLSFDAVAGQTYYFQVGAETRGKLQFMIAPSPTNDAFQDAAPIYGSSGIISGHNLGATFEDSEPLIDSNFYPKYTTTPKRAKSVWWRWTAPASGFVEFDTLGSNIFTVMAVYTGNTLGNLTLITKSSDAGRDPYNGEQPRAGCAEVSFSAVGGTTYYIQVEGGFSDWPSTGLISLELNQSVTPVQPPFVTIAALPSVAQEGGVPGAFLVSRTFAPNTPLDVSVQIGGTAGNGADYETLPTTVTIPAGAYAATLTVTAFQDGLIESNSPETANVTIQSGVGYQLGGTTSASVRIQEAQAFSQTAPTLAALSTGAHALGLEWSFPPSDHTQWRLQTALPIPATQVVQEPFNYVAASALIGSGSWVDGASGTGSATITEGNLSYSGFGESSGRMVGFNNTTRAAFRGFTTAGTVTDVYYSFLLRLDDVTAMSTSWAGLTRVHSGTTNGIGLFVRRAAIGAYDLGVHKRANGGAVETAAAINNLTSGTTYLIVCRYRTEAGTNNDAIDVWVNPTSASFGSNGSIPTPSFSSITGSDTTVDWNTFALFPPASTQGALDELRIGSDWASVTHIPWNTGSLLAASEGGVTITGLAPFTSYSYRVRAESGANVSAWSSVLALVTASAPNEIDWLVTHFNTAFPEGEAAWEADSDEDGQNNVLEYALGSNPTNLNSRGGQTLGIVSGALTLTFTPSTLVGVSYIVEASSNLVDWAQTPLSGLATGEPYVHQDSADLSTTPRRFLRLRVVRP